MRLCYALSKLMNSCFSLNDTTFYALLHSYILIKSHNPGAQFYLKGDLHACFLCPLFSDGETSITDSCAQFPLKLLSTESSGKKRNNNKKVFCTFMGERILQKDKGRWKAGR